MPHPITAVKKSVRGVRGQVKDLAAELEQKAGLLKQLQDEREVLEARHTMLVSLCDTLYFLRENRLRILAAQKAQQDLQQELPPAALHAAARRQQLDQDITNIEELLLLQQLAGIEYSGPHFRGSSLPSLDLSASPYTAGDHQPISPDEDPFLLLRFISTHPPHAEALQWQLPDVMRYASVTVPQLATALAKLDAGLADADMGPDMSSDDGPSESGASADAAAAGGADVANGAAAAGWVRRAGISEHPMHTIQRIQIEWLQILGTIMDECKGMIVVKLPTTNFDTGEQLKEPSKRRHMFAVRALGLTQQQLRRFKLGFGLLQRLQGQLAEQQRGLLEQGTVPPATLSPLVAAAAQSAQSQAVGSAASPLGAAAAAELDFSQSTGARLEVEQAAAAALNQILQKQRLIGGMLMYFLIGTLSWQQYAKLRVLMSPFTQFGPMLQACILEHIAEVQQQQELQKQQKIKEKKQPGRKPAQHLVLGDYIDDGLGSLQQTVHSRPSSNTPAGQYNNACY